MNSYKSTLLNELANDIESNRNYLWANSCNCNCGLLAQRLLGVTEHQLRQIMREDDKAHSLSWGRWEDGVQLVKAFGLHISRPITALLNAGFSLEDIVTLERINQTIEFAPEQERQAVAKAIRQISLINAPKKQQIKQEILV